MTRLASVVTAQEGLGSSNVTGMVNVDDLVNAVGLQSESLLNEVALEIAHATDALFDALVQWPKGTIGHGINSSRYIFGTFPRLVAESRDAHLVVNIDPQRFFIVDKGGYGPHAVMQGLVGSFKGIDVPLEVLLAEDRVHRGEAEFAAWHDVAQVPEAVHRAGGRLDDKIEWYWQFKRFKILAHLGHVLIDDDADALGVASEHDVDQASDHGLALEFDEGLGLGDAFLSQS